MNYFKKSAIIPLIVIEIFFVVALSSCDDNSSDVYNDTGKRLFLVSPETKKCKPMRDYIEINQRVYDHCLISESVSMNLTDEQGNKCNVDMHDLKRKIVIKPIGDAWGGTYEELSLSKLNCPTLGLPK